MAIQKSVVNKFGTTNGSAYARIRSVRVDYDQGTTLSVRLLVDIYATATARSKADAAARKEPIDTLLFTVTDSDATTYFADGVLDDDTKSPLKQAYAYLKTVNDSYNTERLSINWTTGTTDV